MSVRSVVSRASRRTFSLIHDDDAISDLDDEEIVQYRYRDDSTVYVIEPISRGVSMNLAAPHRKYAPVETLHEVDVTEEGSLDQLPLPSPTFTIKRKPVPSRASDSLTTSPSYEKCEQDPPVSPLDILWMPRWLKQSTLVAFSVLFLCFTAALLVLWRVSVSRNGLSVAAHSSEYYWKYGPTAVLVLVMGLWSQVDKYTRLLVPWEVALTQHKTDRHNLLLDYLSPMPHTIVFQAIKNRHFSVLLTTFGSLLLKAIVTASTALLILTPTSVVDKTYQVTLAGSYDPSTFTVPSEYLNTPGDDPSTMLYYGHLENDLALRNGTSATQAFQRPIVPHIAKDSYSITLPVDTFSPIYNCTIPELTILDPLESLEDGSYAAKFTLGIDIPPCPGVTVNESSPAASLRIPTVGLFGGPDGWQYSSYTRLDYIAFGCPDPATADLEGPDGLDSPDLESTDFFLLSETLADTARADGTNGSTLGKIGRLSAIACTVDFRVARTLVRSDQATRDSSQAFSVDNDGLDEEVSGGGLSSALLQSITSAFIYDAADLPGVYYVRQDIDYQAPGIFWDTGTDDMAADSPDETVEVDNEDTVEVEDENDVPEFSDTSNFTKRQTTDMAGTGTDFHSLFHLFARAAEESDWTDTFDNAILKEGAQNAMNGIMAQWAAVRLFNNASAATNAELTYLENRLQVKPLALWFMIAGFLLMSIGSALLIFLRPLFALPESPASLTGFTKILAKQPNLEQILGSALSEDYSRHSTHQRWWRPFTCSKTFIGFMIVVLLCIIGALEVIQHFSNRDHGFVAVDKVSFAVEAWTHYLPAAVMVLIAVAYGAIDFNISVFNQYSKLKRGATSGHTIDNDLTMRMQIQILSTAFATKQWGAALTTTAVLLASGLTIAVSGLYSIGNPNLSFQSTFHVQDAINILANNGSTGDNGVATAISLMDNLELAYPQWTYEDIVIPKLELDPEANMTDTEVSITLPVYRPELSCEYVPSENIIVSTASGPGRAYEPTFRALFVNVTIIPQMTGSCSGLRSPNTSMTTPRFSTDSEDLTVLDEDQGDGTFIGYLAMELNFFDFTQPDGSDRSVPFDDAWIGCPTHAFVFASFSNSSVNDATAGIDEEDYSGTRVDLSVVDVKALQCSQKIEVVDAELSFHLPEFDLDQSKRIIVAEDAPKTYLSTPDIHDSEKPTDSLATHFLDSMDEYYVLLNMPSGFQADYRGFMRALRFGEPEKPPKLFTPDTEDARSAWYNATNALYSQYMAQFLHTNSRVPLDSGAGTTTAVGTEVQQPVRSSYVGTVTSHNSLRILQHRGPKIALQVLLGIIAICVFAAFCLVETKEVLVREPCSMLGKASLVIGGQMLESVRIKCRRTDIRNGVEQLCWTRLSPFKDVTLKLGWWQDIPGGTPRVSNDRDSRSEGNQGWEEDMGREFDEKTERWRIDVVQPEDNAYDER